MCVSKQVVGQPDQTHFNWLDPCLFSGAGLSVLNNLLQNTADAGVCVCLCECVCVCMFDRDGVCIS